MRRAFRLFERNIYRGYTTEVLKEKVISDLAARPVNPAVQSIVNQILQLNLLDTADLVKILKKELNISDAMPMMAQMPMQQQQQQPAAAAEPEPPKQEKTEFKLTLEKYDAAGKAKIIREIKTILPNLNLVEAKNFVEGVPKMIKEKIKKDEAEKIKKTLEELGATVKLE